MANHLCCRNIFRYSYDYCNNWSSLVTCCRFSGVIYLFPFWYYYLSHYLFINFCRHCRFAWSFLDGLWSKATWIVFSAIFHHLLLLLVFGSSFLRQFCMLMLLNLLCCQEAFAHTYFSKFYTHFLPMIKIRSLWDKFWSVFNWMSHYKP